MCACMCVYMCVCAHVHVCGCVCVCMCVGVGVHACVCVRVCACVCVLCVYESAAVCTQHFVLFTKPQKFQHVLYSSKDGGGEVNCYIL